mgnify:CR=1 FL=1
MSSARVLMVLSLGCLSLAAWIPAVQAADPVTPKVVVTNLENPSGIALHEASGDVFVASRWGVYRYNPPSNIVELAIAGYPTDVYGKGPKYNIGPLGVAFMNADHLVVGDGSRPDGEELVRVYKVSEKAKGKDEPVDEKTAEYTLGPITAGEQSAKGEGNFYGVAAGADGIFITCNGDDTKGWVSRIEIKDGKPTELKPFIATKIATNVDAPVAITYSPDGKQLVIGQMGEVNVPGDSLLTFYDPKSGKLTNSYKTDLSDIAGLAYSPTTGKLYAVDFAWAEPDKGGLFELVIDGDAVKSTKIVGLDKPAALAFDKAGKLYLAVFGSGEENAEKSPGTLQVIDAGL